MKELFTVKLLFFLVFIMLTGVSMLAGKMADGPGIHEETLTLKNGRKMRYTLSIPGSYSQQPVPLVLALHYGGQVTPYYGRGVLACLIEPGLRELGAIIAAPDCPATGAQGWANPGSEAAVLELLEHIRKNYRIDSKKIIVTGFSMGGIGAWYLAARHPGLFSAAIPIAGDSDEETVNKIGDIPLYVIHSRADTILPITNTEKIVASLKSKGRAVEFVVLKNVDHYDTSGFTTALRGAVPWLKKVRSKQKRTASAPY
ncbi:MAG: prolyl oligopeptidase family serine peptidase [Candidatus Aminicenantes bacterium]|nr:prolyl oligopeptidase family serine peptidase [Candidatus Aminicenantes bacterium]